MDTLRKMYKYKFCYLWILPFFILFAVFTVYPTVSGFFISLTDYDGLGALEKAGRVGLENYAKAFKDETFWSSLYNTLVVWLLIVPLRTFLALLVAALLNSAKIIGKKIYSVVVLLPYVTAVAVAAIIFKILLSDSGLINVLLGNLFHMEPIPWLTSPAFSKISVAFMNIWRMTGYFSLILLAGMQKIPSSVGEAASIDGAGPVRKFFRVTLPLMIPELFFVMLISTINIFQNIGDVMVLTEGGPLDSSTTLIYYIYRNAYEFSNMGYASAMSYLLFILLMAVSVFVVRSYYRKTGE